MDDTEGFWAAYATELEQARFSLIAAQLLAEEISEKMTLDELREYRHRHRKHIRACHQHLHRAEKLRKKVDRYEKKVNNGNGR